MARRSPAETTVLQRLAAAEIVAPPVEPEINLAGAMSADAAT